MFSLIFPQILEEVVIEWDLGEPMCKMFGGLYFGSFMCSVFTLSAISFERYVTLTSQKCVNFYDVTQL